MSEAYFTYKSRPVVRCGKMIYYGSMAEPYVVMMNIGSEEQSGGIKVATSVSCFLMKTAKNLNPMEAIKSRAERSSLFDALTLADAWLSRESKS